MVGNHRDAWTFGAVDPSSGTTATLEACRAIGTAFKAGWKPRRTLMYASWDAEEYGLVGSTEWADEHAQELDEKAVLMLNVDSAVGGHDLDAQGVPSLRDLFLDAAFSFTGPAQVGEYEGPQRGPRTEEEARRGFATWERVTVNGHSYLVESRVDASSDPNATGSSNGPR